VGALRYAVDSDEIELPALAAVQSAFVAETSAGTPAAIEERTSGPGVEHAAELQVEVERCNASAAPVFAAAAQAELPVERWGIPVSGTGAAAVAIAVVEAPDVSQACAPCSPAWWLEPESDESAP
jgi:hypothetical protein